ncbi:MAG: cell division protein FtsL [Bacillota bacterium]|nr:cell division protein FtsL [Bacillota bacterium]
MIAPEQWYEYQQQYQKYGIDMRPQTERTHVRRQKRKAQNRTPLTRLASIAAGSDRKAMLSLVLVGAIILIMVVVMSSYAAKLTYDINKTQVENDALIGEIEDLDVKMMSSTNISYIEQKAKKELGMKTAGTSSCVFISADDVPEEGFADILKKKAYE